MRFRMSVDDIPRQGRQDQTVPRLLGSVDGGEKAVIGGGLGDSGGQASRDCGYEALTSRLLQGAFHASPRASRSGAALEQHLLPR